MDPRAIKLTVSYPRDWEVERIEPFESSKGSGSDCTVLVTISTHGLYKELVLVRRHPEEHQDRRTRLLFRPEDAHKLVCLLLKQTGVSDQEEYNDTTGYQVHPPSVFSLVQSRLIAVGCVCDLLWSVLRNAGASVGGFTTE